LHVIKPQELDAIPEYVYNQDSDFNPQNDE